MHHRLDGKNGYQQLPIHGDSISPILTSPSNIAAPRYVSFVNYSSRTPPSPLIYGTWMNVIYHAPQQPTTNPAPPREILSIPGNGQSMINKYLLITGTHSLSLIRPIHSRRLHSTHQTYNTLVSQILSPAVSMASNFPTSCERDTSELAYFFDWQVQPDRGVAYYCHMTRDVG